MSGRPVLVAAGGTGGHVVPGLAVCAALARRDVPVIWAGTRQGIESRLVPAAGIVLHHIRIRGLRGQGLLDTALGPFRLARACLLCIGLIRRERPRAVLGMGGFVSGPVALMALLLRVPLVLHEQNAIPGMTNRRLARRATRVFSAFDDVFEPAIGALTIGNPVAHGMRTAPLPSSDAGVPLSILVVGGSRGAERLNELMPAALAHRRLNAAAAALTVRHQAGSGRGESTRARYAAVPGGDSVQVEDFIDDMESAYRDADLVICRAGAMTVTELAARGRAALLVPYPHAVDDHQSANARWLADAGAAVLLPESELDGATLAAAIDRFTGDRETLRSMCVAAARRFRPGAAERVADALIEVSL